MEVEAVQKDEGYDLKVVGSRRNSISITGTKTTKESSQGFTGKATKAAEAIVISVLDELLLEYPKNDLNTITRLQTRDSYHHFQVPNLGYITAQSRNWFYDHRRTPEENVMMILNLKYLTRSI